MKPNTLKVLRIQRREWEKGRGTCRRIFMHTFRLLDNFSGIKSFKLDFSYCWGKAESSRLILTFRRLTDLAHSHTQSYNALQYKAIKPNQQRESMHVGRSSGKSSPTVGVISEELCQTQIPLTFNYDHTSVVPSMKGHQQ